LGATDQMHQLALMRASFIAYQQASHAKQDAAQSMAALRAAVDEFVANYTHEGRSEEGDRFEAAVPPLEHYYHHQSSGLTEIYLRF
jgi:hypothetical protein